MIFSSSSSENKSYEKGGNSCLNQLLGQAPSETIEGIETYVKYYNKERIHSALDCRTSSEAAAAFITFAGV